MQMIADVEQSGWVFQHWRLCLWSTFYVVQPPHNGHEECFGKIQKCCRLVTDCLWDIVSFFKPDAQGDTDSVTPSTAVQVVPKTHTHTNISTRTNTPLFGVIEDAYRRRHKKLMTPAYCERITNLCRAFGCVINCIEKTQLLQVDDGVWNYFRGFVPIEDIYKVSTLLSHRTAHLANTYGWGVDCENIWSELPIYFKTNTSGDGLEWAAQIHRVYAKIRERFNWYQLRTRS